ncbi:transcriptional regulator, GntR family with aminotransferase domain protein [Kribbella flavida DSM 17836]|uniref:Transcriptional regulator, GntR family with aminotransferase domain protein n=1 Tax=Kribbella flavida (strain DSM 17836 / JCM 10339 / NBRC 14399) TaxID=479435 RepID=D2PMR5_KRIFD|nr:PLP-dependent aminotransferase family protein [Kribbella flavida]ADB32617.1 transcriptional regulator, GntR family with aminotransferase domain protein [Kribbella flavida DSM 17836]
MNERSTTDRLIDGLRAVVQRSAPGEKLPSSRELVDRYRVGPGTVARVIAQLAAEGVVETRPGSGTFVATPARHAAALPDFGWQTVALADRAVDPGRPLDNAWPPGTIRLDGGYLHQSLQPVRALSSALARAARRPDAWDRAPVNGLQSLRAVFAAWCGPSVAPDDVLVTGGGQSALSIAFRAIAAPGSPVLVESPTYPGALAAARAAGLRPVPVPTDAEGLRPDLLAEAFARSGARVLYCQPTYQNPTGAVLSADRRRQVVEVARAAGAFVIEDDFARFLGHGGPVAPPGPLLSDDRDGTVVLVTSLTKPAAPSLRIGALVARGPVRERLRAIRQVDDFFVPRPLQEAALELISSPAWERHLKTLATALRQRCHTVVTALAEQRPDWAVDHLPAGGLHIWVRIQTDDPAVAEAARDLGVAVSAGSRYFAAERPGSWLRLNFAATADLTDLVTAAHRLAPASPLR